MDFDESDDEGLPTHADSTSGSLGDDPNTSSSFPSSGLVDATQPIQEPPSPGTARKRANEEIDEESQRPLPSTTPLKPPPSFSSEDRGFTEPQKSAAWKVSFRDAQVSETTRPSSQMAKATAEPPTEATSELVAENTFVENVAAYQKHLEDDFKDYENELKGRERSHELQELDWQDLEDRYQNEISMQIADEEAIMKEFQQRFAQFMLWMQVSGSRESERAVKRLRTRVAFVQNSEGRLGERQEHYGKVLAAFQNAMALLGNA